MFSSIVLMVVLAGVCTGLRYQDSRNQVRMKRNVYQFGRMVLCETKRWPSDYIGYGCWCGLGGKGTPIDDTDKCCNVHDLCYMKAHRSVCYMGAAYTTIYKRKGCSDCDKSKNNACQQAVCECDSVAVKCFAKSKFNDEYKRYSQSKCVL